MKRLIIAIIGLIVVVAAVVFWGLSQTGPENAPQEIKVIDLEDNYEK